MKKKKNSGGYKMIQDVAKQVIFSPIKKQKQKKKEVEDFSEAKTIEVKEVKTKTFIIKNKFSELKITAPLLTAYDYKVMSAFFTYVYSNIVPNISKSKSERFLKSIEKREYDRVLEEYFSVKVKLHQFIKSFMKTHAGTIQYQNVIKSFEKLYQTSIEFTYNFTKTKTTVRFRPIAYFLTSEHNEEIEKNTAELGVSYLLLYLMTEKNALFLNNDIIQKTRSAVATALVSFLQTTTGNTYSLSFLTEHLHLNEKRKDNAKRDIKNAFKELVEIGYLSEFEEEKKEDDIYFHFKRKKKQNSKQN